MRWGIYENAAERWRIPCVPVTEVSIRRRWVYESVEALRLPLTMAAVGGVRTALPSWARTSLRRFAHAQALNGRR